MSEFWQLGQLTAFPGRETKSEDGAENIREFGRRGTNKIMAFFLEEREASRDERGGEFEREG